jgi:phosphatidylglycerol lysyltransferase
MNEDRKDDRALDLLRAFGRDAISFVGLEGSMRHWFDQETRGFVAYVETRGAWVACGAPVGDRADVVAIASRFVLAAKARGRRASFFATEAIEFEGAAQFKRTLIGEQPIVRIGDWAEYIAKSRNLRGQLRYARSKKVTVRYVDAAEVTGLLRPSIDELTKGWLAARLMAPMHFLVALDPFARASEHRYFVAEQEGKVIAFLSAVPIYERASWLVEDILRSKRAPNGTAELLIDALVQNIAPSSHFFTLGLTPLSGHVANWLKIARFVMRPLYDFEGLRAFKARLRPSHWEPVYTVHPRTQPSFVAILDALDAFAGGAPVMFAMRTIVRHPHAPAFALAAPLAPWTLLLATIAATLHASLLGFSTRALFAWTAYDIVLFVLLIRCARHPTPWRLAIATFAAAGDAALSMRHLIDTGFGRSIFAVTLRLLGTLGPSLGTLALAWATFTSRRASRANR